MEELPPDHRGKISHWSRVLCPEELFLMKWRLWNSYCLNWVSRLKPSQSTKTAKLQSTWLAILSNTSESSILTYGITLSARRCWRDGHRTEDPHKSQPFDMYTKAVSKVVFDTLSLFIVCRTETLWWYYGHYYWKDTFYDLYYSTDIRCCMWWNSWTILFRLGRYEPSQFHVFFEHRGSVNVKLGIVQVKLRFHGGTRGKERVKD